MPRTGRPSEYDQKYVGLVLDYASNPKKFDDPVPTVEGACCEIGISKQCFYEWAQKFPDFGDAAKLLVANQGRLLQKYGLLGKTNPMITKLMLSANHDMREKTDSKQENSGSVEVVIRKQ